MDRMKEFKEQSVEELKVLIQEYSRDIYQMHNELRMTRKLEKPHLLKQRKRDRARVLTLLKQKGVNVR